MKRTQSREKSRLAAHLMLVAVLVAGCDRGGERDPFAEVTGPIVGIVPAASIGEPGQPVDPGLAFSPDAPKVTAVAQVGRVSGSPMDFTWFVLAAEGEQQLFTHTVEVSSFQVAYSVGVNPGTLTSGTYRVQATLEGTSLSTQFEVTAPDGGAPPGEAATAGNPVAGESGAVGPPAVVGPDETGLFTFLDYAPVDPDARTIGATIIAGVKGGSGRVEAKATMGGNTRTTSFPTDESGLVQKILTFDPCVHPGGSDLPGTDATFDFILYEGDTAGPSDTYITKLGPDQTLPVLEVTSNPPPGSRVEPGQTIVVSIVAREIRDGGTWQTGVKQLRLTDFDTGEVLGEQVFGEEALACEQKAWSKGLDVPFTVPGDAPPVIRLTAEGLDFAENRGSFGLSYYTGEVWKGNVTGEQVQAACTPASVPMSGDLTVQVANDGTVTGTVTERRAGFSCGGVPAPDYAQTFPITGQKTAEAFELNVGTLPITGSRATMTVQNVNAGYGATVTYTIDCATCKGS